MKEKLLNVFLLTVLGVITSYYLLTMKFNLHCTQYTSLKIALFDMEVHVEEGFDSTPLIYISPYAKPLRLYFLLNLLMFLYFPIATSILAVLKKMSLKKSLTGMGCVTIIFALNTGLAFVVAGERFFFLNLIALLWGIMLYSACALVTYKAALAVSDA